jgi:hydroxypyruvate isomerase
MNNELQSPGDVRRPTRRQTLAAGATAAVALASLTGRASAAAEEPAQRSDGGIKHGRLKQSVVQWCFQEHWDIDRTCQVARQLGCGSVELVGPEHWPTLKKHGLVCACVPSHGFKIGFNDPADWPQCIEILQKRIDLAADAGFPNVITFTGYRKERIPDDVGAKNCVEGFKKVVGQAEKRNVTLVLEMLNSRVSDHPMKGHPGYQGDHTDYCVDILKQVGSERMKLLFDVYHVQIMDGDVITRIRQHKDYIAHVHTAGNPGRGELDAAQEINYPPIMQALVDVGYKGFVGQEFIPTRDPLAGLTQAVHVCDV